MSPSSAAIDRGLAEKPEEVAGEGKGDKSDDRSDGNARMRTTLRAVPVIKSDGAYLYLALRDNNMTAFVQRSNVLPVGERMKYVATDAYYAATYQPQRGGKVFSTSRALSSSSGIRPSRSSPPRASRSTARPAISKARWSARRAKCSAAWT